MISNEVSKLLLQIAAVSFRFNPPFTYTTGMKSPIYLDNRIVMSYPKVREKIVDFYVKKIKEEIKLKNVEWIAGTATAAIPHASFIASQLKLPLVYVRPTTKSYGKGNQVEGYIKKGSKVLIVEDHISTASSVIETARAVRAEGGKVNYCIATTTYETPMSKDNIKKSNLKLIALTTGKNIVETAMDKKYITAGQKKIIDDWFTDPKGWAKRNGFV